MFSLLLAWTVEQIAGDLRPHDSQMTSYRWLSARKMRQRWSYIFLALAHRCKCYDEVDLSHCQLTSQHDILATFPSRQSSRATWTIAGFNHNKEPLIAILAGEVLAITEYSGISHTDHRVRSVAWSILLTHWGRVTHICISRLIIIGSDNGLSPGWCQAIIWTNAGILLIRTLTTNFSEILSEIHAFSFKKMHLKILLWNGSDLSRPQCINPSYAAIVWGNMECFSHVP